MQNPRLMGFLSSGTFWGAVIILFGLSIILKEVFHVHLPIMRILIGIVFIYVGAKVIAGGFGRHWDSRSDAVFGSANMKYDSDKGDYNIIFGSGTIDLSHIRSVIENRKIEVNVVFGSGRLIINDSIPVIVRSSTAFGSTMAPNQNASAFGDLRYTSPTYVEGQPHLTIETNAVFGRLDIVRGQW